MEESMDSCPAILVRNLRKQRHATTCQRHAKTCEEDLKQERIGEDLSRKIPTAIQPFLTIALPVMITLFLGIWSQNKRFDDMSKRTDDTNRRIDDLAKSLHNQLEQTAGNINRRLDESIKGLERIETKLDKHEERLIRLEERASPIKGIR
jgi:vacuolar-type H+-ATPase subunit I/STV1